MNIARPVRKRPPTPHQRSFAHAIAKTLDITEPDYSEGFEGFAKFISRNVDNFYKLKNGKRKNIDSAGIITIEKEDTVFDVLDKFFAALERFDKQDGTSEYWTEDGAGLMIHASLGDCNAMTLLKASIEEIEKDKQVNKEIVSNIETNDVNVIVEKEVNPFD